MIPVAFLSHSANKSGANPLYSGTIELPTGPINSFVEAEGVSLHPRKPSLKDHCKSTQNENIDGNNTDIVPTVIEPGIRTDSEKNRQLLTIRSLHNFKESQMAPIRDMGAESGTRADRVQKKVKSFFTFCIRVAKRIFCYKNISPRSQQCNHQDGENEYFPGIDPYACMEVEWSVDGDSSDELYAEDGTPYDELVSGFSIAAVDAECPSRDLQEIQSEGFLSPRNATVRGNGTSLGESSHPMNTNGATSSAECAAPKNSNDELRGQMDKSVLESASRYTGNAGHVSLSTWKDEGGGKLMDASSLVSPIIRSSSILNPPRLERGDKHVRPSSSPELLVGCDVMAHPFKANLCVSDMTYYLQNDAKRCRMVRFVNGSLKQNPSSSVDFLVKMEKTKTIVRVLVKRLASNEDPEGSHTCEVKFLRHHNLKMRVKTFFILNKQRWYEKEAKVAAEMRSELVSLLQRREGLKITD